MIRIRAEVPAATHIFAAAVQCRDLAKKLDCVVVFDYDGEEFAINSGTSPISIQDMYLHELRKRTPFAAAQYPSKP